MGECWFLGHQIYINEIKNSQRAKSSKSETVKELYKVFGNYVDERISY